MTYEPADGDTVTITHVYRGKLVEGVASGRLFVDQPTAYIGDEGVTVSEVTPKRVEHLVGTVARVTPFNHVIVKTALSDTHAWQIIGEPLRIDPERLNSYSIHVEQAKNFEVIGAVPGSPAAAEAASTDPVRIALDDDDDWWVEVYPGSWHVVFGYKVSSATEARTYAMQNPSDYAESLEHIQEQYSARIITP